MQFSCFRLLGLCLWSTAAISASQPAGGDFEDVALGKLPDGWSGAAAVVRVDGRQCVRVPGGSNNSLRTSLVPVDPKAKYALHFDLLIQHTSMNFWVQFQSFDSQRRPIAPEWHNPAVACYSSDLPVFVPVVHPFEPGAKFGKTAFVSVVFKWGRDSAGAAWVDNLRVVQTIATKPIKAAEPLDLSKWVNGRAGDHGILRTLARLAPEFRLGRRLRFSISRGRAADSLGVIVSSEQPNVRVPLRGQADSVLLFYAPLSPDGAASATAAGDEAGVDLASGGHLAAVLRTSDGKGYASCWLQEIALPSPRAGTPELRLHHKAGTVALLAATAVRGGPAMPHIRTQDRVLYSPSDASWLSVHMPMPQAPGGGLDVSFVLEPPAGKRGFVHSRDGHFYFNDGTRARFFGTTVGYSAPFQTHEVAEQLADHIARNGFNLVRIHPDNNLFDRSTGGTRVFDEQQRDRLEYFIAQLKRRGIYTYFYSPMSREFTLKDGVKVPGRHHITGMWNPRRIELMKEWWTNLLTHRSPYTKLRLVDDPMLAMLVMMNENEVLTHYASAPEPYKAELQAMWNAWLVRRHGPRRALAARWGDKLRPGEDAAKGSVKLGGQGLRAYDFGLFCDERQRAFAKDMGGHLRGIGVRAPMAVTNHPYSSLGLRTLADTADFVGFHWYWSHPAPGGVAVSAMLEGANPSSGMRHPATIGNMAKVRGKPMIVGEWNAPWPEPYRHDVILQMAAYGCMQDWDALVHFLEAAFTPLDRPELRCTGHPFDSIFDPARQRLLPFATLMFHRGDVSAARKVVEIVAPWQEIDRRARDNGWPRYLIPPALNVPPLISRTRLTLGDPDPAADAHLTLGPMQGLARSLDWSPYYSERRRAADTASAFGQAFAAASEQWGWGTFSKRDMAGSRFASDTGEIVSDFERKVFTIDTPRCQAVVGFPNAAGKVELSDVVFELGRPCSAIMISLSDEPIGRADRLILAVVGDSVNASLDLLVPRSIAYLLLKGVVEAPPNIACSRNGRAPVLVEPIPGRVTLRGQAGPHQAFVLGSDGQRARTAKAARTAAGLEIDLRAGGYLWEIAR